MTIFSALLSLVLAVSAVGLLADNSGLYQSCVLRTEAQERIANPLTGLSRLEQLKSGYCAFAHVLNIPKRSKGVKYIIPNSFIHFSHL